MKLILWVSFFLSSLLLIFLTLFFEAKHVQLKYIETYHQEHIQTVFMKDYLKRRDVHMRERSTLDAEKSIAQLLKRSPILFTSNDASFENNSSMDNNSSRNRVTLAHINKILIHMKEKVFLGIETHTDSFGTKKNNLQLSQKRADRLKKYFEHNPNVSFITSIGYGEEIPLKNAKKNSDHRRVEIKLKGYNNDRYNY